MGTLFLSRYLSVAPARDNVLRSITINVNVTFGQDIRILLSLGARFTMTFKTSSRTAQKSPTAALHWSLYSQASSILPTHLLLQTPRAMTLTLTLGDTHIVNIQPVFDLVGTPVPPPWPTQPLPHTPSPLLLATH